jgi:histidinol phosphatase-like PHP family hydrolase
VTDSRTLRLLVVSDLHARSAGSSVPPAEELLERAVFEARQTGGLDAVILAGDLLDLDAGEAVDVPALTRVARTLETACPDVPRFACCGNHDGDDPAAVHAVLGTRPGPQALHGVGVWCFDDRYRDARWARRDERELAAFGAWAGESDRPVICVQHNPVFPAVEDETYPYMLENNSAVLAAYASRPVALSISGHYHDGQGPAMREGTCFLTARALREAPWNFCLVEIDPDGTVRAGHRALRAEESARLWDTHVHTEFAYCAQDVTAGDCARRLELLGLAGGALVEHAPQLYCRAEDFWEARHVNEPRLWRSPEHSRMADFRRRVQPLRGEGLLVGLEVELDADGQLTCLDEDRLWPDLLVGAVHWLPGGGTSMADPRAGLEGFMKTCEGLCRGGIDILAHPFRAVRKAPPERLRALHGPLADLLAETGTAAEVNFHINRPDAAFFAACIERGVKIAFGSDAHRLGECGQLGPHVDLLREAARADRSLEGLLYRPGGRDR